MCNKNLQFSGGGPLDLPLLLGFVPSPLPPLHGSRTATDHPPPPHRLYNLNALKLEAHCH